MTTPVLGALSPEPVVGVLKKKRVLLVDVSPTKRDSRAESMRNLGIEVDCAADINEARSWWRASLYDLVLMNVECGLGQRDKFCDDIRVATPPQRLAFLVGKPGYLADAPGAEASQSVPEWGDQSRWRDVKAALLADIPGSVPQCWGIMEASRRISAVRSLSHAPSKSAQRKAVPQRDVEPRDSKRTVAEPRTLDDLLREEMQ